MNLKFTDCRKFLSLHATLMSGLQALKRPCFVTIYSNRSTPFWGWNCMRNEASSRLFSLQIALRIPHWEKSDLSNHRMTNWRCGPFLLRFSSGLPSPLWRGQRLSRPFGISLKCKHWKKTEILNKSWILRYFYSRKPVIKKHIFHYILQYCMKNGFNLLNI